MVKSFLPKRFNNAIRKMLRAYYKLIYSKQLIDDRLIIVSTFQGDFTCNPKPIIEELLRRFEKVSIYWVVKSTTKEECFPEKVKLVRKNSKEYYKIAMKAKILIDNAHNFCLSGIELREEQVLLQVWHGSLGIKRLDGNIVMNKSWLHRAEWSEKYTSYCISNSKFETKVFQTSYWKNVPVLLYGHARNDAFFMVGQELLSFQKKVKQSIGLSEDTKLLLFAPTHRDYQEEKFLFDFEKVYHAVKEKFGGDWKIGIRFHSRLKEKSREWVKELPQYVFDLTEYPDIQDILMIVDIGITDYSSWIFDFVLRKLPGFLLTEDLLDYVQARDFYYPLSETPFPIANNMDSLVENIINFDDQMYKLKIDRFLSDRGCIDDGHAAERVADKIVEIIKNSANKKVSRNL